jgi:HEAT repeat protein
VGAWATIADVTPGERVRSACARHGDDAVVTWCAELVAGASWGDSADSLDWVVDATAHSESWLRNPVNQYWPRVWAARAFLYAWRDHAASAVVAGLSDEAWRVREMCAKVARLREIGETGGELSTLVNDPVTRVRVAALRGLAVVGDTEHAAAVVTAQGDPESTVRRAAELAHRDMARRLDHPLQST